MLTLEQICIPVIKFTDLNYMIQVIELNDSLDFLFSFIVLGWEIGQKSI